MRYGLDFGTSNSAIAIYRERGVELIPIDPAAPNPGTVRTLLWIDRDGKVAIGEEAVNAFVAGNVGRQIVKSRLWYNEFVTTEFGDEYIQFDVDTEIPGRFFQALKSTLKDPDYVGTDVFGTAYTIEELVAYILREIKTRADTYYGQPVDEVVLGRPVLFADDKAKDKLAEERLRRAAELAGFHKVVFMHEPLGAALHYASRLDLEELALVFDFGGGTLDLSIMRLGPDTCHHADETGDVLAVGGLVLGRSPPVYRPSWNDGSGRPRSGSRRCSLVSCPD